MCEYIKIFEFLCVCVAAILWHHLGGPHGWFDGNLPCPINQCPDSGRELMLCDQWSEGPRALSCPALAWPHVSSPHRL